MRALVSAQVQPGYLDPTWSDSREGVAVAVGFSGDVCLRPNEGRGEVESLGVAVGKGLVAVAVGFRGKACLGPNEGRGEVELLGATTGKGLVAVTVGFSGEACLEPNEGREVES